MLRHLTSGIASCCVADSDREMVWAVAWRRGLERLGGAGRNCIFLTDTGRFLTEKIWVLRISMLPLNSPKMGDFQPPSLVFLDENSPTIEGNFFQRLFGGFSSPFFAPFPSTTPPSTGQVQHGERGKWVIVIVRGVSECRWGHCSYVRICVLCRHFLWYYAVTV